MNLVRVGVIGCGIMGMRHLAAAANCMSATPAGVVDLFPIRAKDAARQFGVTKIFSHASEMIADREIDAMVFATPAGDRDELVVEAIKAGKHVLIEKPAAMNAANIERMIAARSNAVVASCSCRFHAYDSARAAAGFVATGALGQIRSVYCRVFTKDEGKPSTPPPAWRLRKSANGGGILVNWGSYDLDFLLGVCDWKLRPELVLARIWGVPERSLPNVAEGSDAETHVAALVLCGNNSVIQYERGEFMPSHPEQTWQILGTHGALNLTMIYEQDKVISFDETIPGSGVHSREIWRGDDSWESMQGFEFYDFIDAITEAREPQTSLEKALTIQRLFDAIYESAKRGEAVAIL